MRELAARVADLADSDGLHMTRLARVTIHKRTSFTSLGPRVLKPGLGVVLSGGKRFDFAGSALDYGAGEWIVTPNPVATTCAVTQASSKEPYLALLVELDARLIADAIAAGGPDLSVSDSTARPLGAAAARRELTAPITRSRLDDTLSDVLLRMVRLLDSPEDAKVVGPLVERELLHRLLQSDQRSVVRGLGLGDRAVLKVLREIESRFAARLSIEDLARSVHLGVSSLHHRFKAAMGTSPLQYLKKVRLREARRLMVEERFDAASAAYAVGYASSSQFSRDYRRAYDLPPRRDVARFSVS